MGNKYIGELGTDVYGVALDEGKIGSIEWDADQAAASSATAILAATAGVTAAAGKKVTTDITNPPCVRTLTVTGGGTEGDIKAGSVKVTGTNYLNEVIEEEFAFTADTGATKAGTKAFKTVTSVFIPQQDGTGATFSVGTGEKLGLPFKLSFKPLFLASFDGAADAGALTIDDDEIEKNVYDSNSNLNGKAIKLALIL